MKLTTLFISPIIILTLHSCKNSSESVFTDKTSQDTIKQNIGGSLIRNIHYYDDLSSAIYDIKYSYKDEFDSVSEIGLGSYYNEQPPKDEQLMNIDKWKILKVCKDRDADLLFVYNTTTKTWTKYEVSPESIEQTDMWKMKNIDSQVDNWDSVSKVENIEANGNISVIYTFPKKGRIVGFINQKRKVTYKIDRQTGEITMTQIQEI